MEVDVPRFAAHATCATFVTQSSSACRPDGNVTRAVSIQSGVRGDALLVDRLVLGAVRVALQLRRPLEERADDAVADRDVVLDVVELRQAGGAEIDLVRVRDLDRASPDLELDEWRGHSGTRYRRGTLAARPDLAGVLRRVFPMRKALTRTGGARPGRRARHRNLGHRRHGRGTAAATAIPRLRDRRPQSRRGRTAGRSAPTIPHTRRGSRRKPQE